MMVEAAHVRGIWKTLFSLLIVVLVGAFLYLFFAAGPVYLLGSYYLLIEWICWILIAVAAVAILTAPLRRRALWSALADLLILLVWGLAIQLFFTKGPYDVFGSFSFLAYVVCMGIVFVAAVVTVVRWVSSAARSSKRRIKNRSAAKNAQQQTEESKPATEQSPNKPAVAATAAAVAVSEAETTTEPAGAVAAEAETTEAVTASSEVAPAPEPAVEVTHHGFEQSGRKAIPVAAAVAGGGIAAAVASGITAEDKTASTETANESESTDEPVTEAATNPATTSEAHADNWGAWDAWTATAETSGTGEQEDTSADTTAFEDDNPSMALMRQQVALDRKVLITLMDSDQLRRYVAGSLLEAGYKVKDIQGSGDDGTFVAKRGKTRALIVFHTGPRKLLLSDLNDDCEKCARLECNALVLATSGPVSEKAERFIQEQNITVWTENDMRDLF